MLRIIALAFLAFAMVNAYYVEFDERHDEDLETDFKGEETPSLGADDGNYRRGLVAWGNKYYLFSTDELTWYEAMAVCENVVTWNHNGWLTHIASTGERDFVRDHIGCGKEAWIGGTDIMSYGHYVWYHWQVITNWYQRCKAQQKQYAQCLYMDANGQISGGDCLTRRPFVCERRTKAGF